MNPPPRRSNRLKRPLSPESLASTTTSDRTKKDNPFLRGATLRLFVSLANYNGQKFVVPISASSTVADLHAEAVRRAVQLNVHCTTGNTVLRSTSHDGAIFFGEDLLMDILDMTDDETFLLDSFAPPEIPSSITLGTASSLSVSTTSTVLSSSLSVASETTKVYSIYVRWVTPQRALASSRLSRIDVDTLPIQSDTSLSSFKKFAFDRLYDGQSTDTDITVELFLSGNYLSCNDAVSLSDLKLKGSRNHPLHVFVVLIRNRTCSKVHDAWGFETSDRGVASFVTSLKIFLNEISNKRNSLDNVMEVLWSVTHFPPAVIAFRELYIFGVSCARPLPLTVFTTCFRELSLLMVPRWICHEHSRVLEASRQVFAWLNSLASDPSSKGRPIVHEVVLTELNNGQCNVNERNDDSEFDKCVEIPDLTVSTTSASTSKMVHVHMNGYLSTQLKPDYLALALAGAYNQLGNFVFALPQEIGRFYHCKRLSALHPSDFDNLLEAANTVDAFKMISPMQLAACLSSALPVITLCSQGYVSLYEKEDRGCGERYFYTSNEIVGRENMPTTNPYQFLLQKIQPIITQRKEEGTWEVDAWTQHDLAVDPAKPVEAIVICVDISYSMDSPMGPQWNHQGSDATTAPKDRLSRLTEVKEVFKNLVARISAYTLPVHLGLVTFSGGGNVSIVQSLTPVANDFRDKLVHVVPSGSTAMWNALIKGKEMLSSLKATSPDSKLRIILLTDGEDNSSRFRPGEVCHQLYNEDVVLDTIVIGTNQTSDLFKIAKHTGGYAFSPQSRNSLFQIFLLETFLDIRVRPEIVRVPIIDYALSTPKEPDMKDIFDFPPMRPHPNQNDQFFSVRDANRFLASSRPYAFTNITPSSRASSVFAASEIAFSRLGSISDTDTMMSDVTGRTLTPTSGSTRSESLREVRAAIDNHHDYMDIYVSESNMDFWKVVMEGPPGSPYASGTFVLYVEHGADLPRKAPLVRFITPILHPNITKHGRICHPIFGREWNHGIRTHTLLQHVWGMLMTLEARDAVDPLFTLTFWTNPEAGALDVKRYIQRFASRSRRQLRAEILGVA
ncbi:hypothetical protein BDD12DRAFT_849140 [Trichophaea hybrida]|nr:hypothetical protein BDD12DRAFT_849140 [Trichophaea hybrida]